MDPTRRFSGRVEFYAKYRPGYPPLVYDYLRAEAGLQPGAELADLGSGTGLLSQLFISRGHRVFAIEPNAEMRAAAEQFFTGQPNFVSLAGRAEAIPSPDSRVDFVTAGQSFHWFEPLATRREIQRVLRTGCQAALIWNSRRIEASPFQQAYEKLLLRFGTDFRKVDHKRNSSEEKLAAFFAPGVMKKAVFPNEQTLDFDGLRGRLLSSSYAPTPDHPDYPPMLAALKSLFDEFKVGGRVRFEYQTEIYHGLMT